MRILYRFHRWLIFARVIALFMFVWPYVRPHILCMQLVFCRILFIFGILVGHDLSMCIIYRFHGWLISARVIALFMFVWQYVRLVYATSHLSFVGFYSYLVSWLAMIWACTYIDFRGIKECKECWNPPRTVGTKINHPWNRYNMRMLRSWPTKIPNMNKIQQKTD
jgi:hypothetical protein